MDVENIVVGSGLAALGAVMGLLVKDNAPITVLCGPQTNQFSYYDARQTVPCAFLGAGGLGSHWHGVIPTGWHHVFEGATQAGFVTLFEQFYPRADIQKHLGQARIFVPWKPIRPFEHLERLAKRHAARLHLVHEPALQISMNDARGLVTTPSGTTYRARRVWVAAGALHTPALLATTFGEAIQRDCASDHVFCYVGQVDGHAKPLLNYCRDGIFFPAVYDAQVTALYTVRPARFAFSKLDFGIEQRAVFGLPTGNAVAKIMKRLSPGLLVEAFYNRFGWFGGSKTHSVYAQVAVPDAYFVPAKKLGQPPTQPLTARLDSIKLLTDAARLAQPFGPLRQSQRREIYLPGMHVHHTLDLPYANRCGINAPESAIQVVDASVLEHIGPHHHSFKMMLAAHDLAYSIV
jgi:hypothetical protein